MILMSFPFQQYNVSAWKVSSSSFLSSLFLQCAQELFALSRPKFICNMLKCSPTLSTVNIADEKHPGGGSITFDFMVSKLSGDTGMSTLMSLMVSGLEFTRAYTSKAAYVMIRRLNLFHFY